MKPPFEINVQDLARRIKEMNSATKVKAALGVCVFVAFCFWVGYPAWFVSIQMKQNISDFEGRIAQVENLKKNEKSWIKQKKELTDYIQFTRGRLFLPGETSLLLGRVAELADRNKVFIVASKPSDEKFQFPDPYEAELKADRYDFVFEGGYHDIGRFISDLEGYPKILKIQLFELKPNAANPARHTASLAITAVSSKERKV